jgi:hypothetical protein
MADNEIVAIFFNMADRDCQSKWLSIIGIGEDGLEGLSSVGRSLLSLASVIVGGERHLAMLPQRINGKNCSGLLPFKTLLTRLSAFVVNPSVFWQVVIPCATELVSPSPARFPWRK